MFRFINKYYLSLFFLLNGFVFSQTNRISTYGGLIHLLSENGLSQNTVHRIIQDSKGFMWFATEDGLNKFDGYSFTVYKNNVQDKNSISDNFIWTIYEDKKGFLWIGTNSGGLCGYDYKSEKFISYKNNPDDINSLTLNNVRTIYEDRKGNIWIGTENGLDKFDRKKNTFTHFRNNPNDPSSLSNNVVLSLFEDNEGVIWVGSDGGLGRFDESKNSFLNYTFNQDDAGRKASNVVLTIYQDKNEFLWIGTLKGLIRFDKKNENFSGFIVNSSEINSINSNRVNTLLEDKNGILWVGTGDGLFHFNRSNNQFIKATPLLSVSDILNNNNVLSLYEDNSGLIWIGTAEDGIVKYDKERIKFKNYRHDQFNNNSLSHNTIRSIYGDENEILWIGTLGGGLNRFDKKNNRFTHFKSNPADPSSLSDNSVSAIFKDSRNYLWVGTWGGGLNRTILPGKKNLHDLKFITYRNEQSKLNSISSNIIQAIYEDSKKRIWVGTGNGLSLYDRNKDQFINFVNDPDNLQSLSSNQVQSCILEDSNGNLWIGTWNGLNKISSSNIDNAMINPHAVKFKRYRFQPDNQNSLSDERIISGFEDSKGNLWFGTYGGGLNKLPVDQHNSAEEKFINYSVDEGLSSNIIYKILNDDDDKLWLSTDNGLSMFDPEKEEFRNYDVSDGLQGNQFFWGAGFKGKNGELFFGGTNGFNSFKPAELNKNFYVPPVLITNFQIFNKPVEIEKKNSPLSKSIIVTEAIELSYNQNVFSFEFAALDYTVPGKNLYSYKMEGFDNDWIYSGNRRYVTYTNLDPGEYVFRVKGSNNDGIWNEKGASVIIKISPPLWKRGWFIMLAILFAAAFLSAIIYYRVKHLLDMERLRTKLAADLHDNIGSSLTEISILSEVISKKIESADEGVRKSLNMISSNSRNLIDNMSDIVWLVNPKRDSLYDLILRLRDTYSELSSYTSISFRSENIKSLEKVSLSMEHRQHLYLIFKEAINNCITHSGCSEITLDASVKGKKLQMTLKDNGKGFCPDEISGNGNGLNNIKNRAKVIGGVIKILSKTGEGTTVQFEGNII